jgi:hypothetical protein
VSTAPPPPEAFFVPDEPTPDDVIPRDQYGHPMIVPPPGVDPQFTKGKWAGYTPYSRASGFGSQIEDGTNLVKWQKRQVARGVAIRYEQHKYELGPNGGLPANPFIEPTESYQKKQWNAVAEDAEEAVGSYAKATRGTAIHAATEYIDTGDVDAFNALPPDLKERAQAYHAFCKEWRIVPTSVEVFGVEDEHRVAGTWDRTGHCLGRHRILDVKTSSTMDFAGIGFGVQLAEYAHASRYDPETHERVPHEDIDLETAYIIHVDREMHGPVELFKVDISVGWRYAQTVNAVIQARRDGAKAITEVPDRLREILLCTTRDELRAAMAIHAGPEATKDQIEAANALWKVLP